MGVHCVGVCDLCLQSCDVCVQYGTLAGRHHGGAMEERGTGPFVATVNHISVYTILGHLLLQFLHTSVLSFNISMGCGNLKLFPFIENTLNIN